MAYIARRCPTTLTTPTTTQAPPITLLTNPPTTATSPTQSPTAIDFTPSSSVGPGGDDSSADTSSAADDPDSDGGGGLVVIIAVAAAAAVVCIGLGAVVYVRRRTQKAAVNLRANRMKRAAASTINPTYALAGVAPSSRRSIDLLPGGPAGYLEVAGENATYAEIADADAELSAGYAGYVAPSASGTAVPGASPAGTRPVYKVNPVVGDPRGRYDSFDPTRTADGDNAYAMPLAADDGSPTASGPPEAGMPGAMSHAWTGRARCDDDDNPYSMPLAADTEG